MSQTAWRLDSTDPLVRQHVIKGRTIVPLASWLSRCLSEVTALQGGPPCELRAVLVRRPVVLAEGGSLSVVFTGKPEASSGSFEVRAGDLGTVDRASTPPLVEGTWRNGAGDPATRFHSCGQTALRHDAFYAAACDAGFAYGPLLRPIRELRREGEAWTADVLLLGARADPAVSWAIQCDALLQTGSVTAAAGTAGCWVPFGVDQVRPGEYGGAIVIDRICGEWIGSSSGDGRVRIANISGFGPGEDAARIELRGVRFGLLEQLNAEQTRPRHTTEVDAPVVPGSQDVLRVLQSAAAQRRRPILLRFIEDQLLEVLQWDDSERAKLSAGFAAVGLDSLMSVDLQYRLQTALEFALPLGESFDVALVEELADLLLGRYLNLE